MVDNLADVITELPNSVPAPPAGTPVPGNDTVRTSLTSFTLGVTAASLNVENLTYTGAAAFSGVGTAGANLKFLSFRSNRRSPKCPSLLWNIAVRRLFFASFCSH